MSVPDAAVVAADAHFINFKMQYSSLAMLYYDYALTFPDELRYIWRWDSLKQFSTLLYIACRYALPGNLLYLLAHTNSLGGIEHCNQWYRAIAGLSVAGRAAVVIVLGIRTYAMCGRSKLVLLILFPAGVLIPILDIIENLNLSCSPSAYPKKLLVPDDLLFILVPVYDFVAAGITVIRGVQALKRMPGATKADLRDSLYYLLVEQGILYFFAVTAATMIALVINFHPVDVTSSAAFLGEVNAFTIPLSGLLTARFILSLRAAGQRGLDGTEDDTPTLRFAKRTDSSDDQETAVSGGDLPWPGSRGRQGTTSILSVPWQVFDSVVNEFGDDPLERIQYAKEYARAAEMAELRSAAVLDLRSPVGARRESVDLEHAHASSNSGISVV